MRIALAIATFSVAGCTSSQVAKLPTTTTTTSVSKLQFAVGVATFSQSATSVLHLLNVVETYRNATGSSATTTNTPTLSGPSGAFGAPSLSAITGLTLPQQSQIAADITERGSSTFSVPATTSAAFGSAYGAFGYGLAPDNLGDPQASRALVSSCPSTTLVVNDSVRYLAADVPFDAVTGGGFCDVKEVGGAVAGITPTRFYGGPPLWPSPLGFGQPQGFVGWASGFSVFFPCADSRCTTPASVIAGDYSFAVAAPIGGANQTAYGSVSTSATLPAAVAAAPLPPIDPPTISVQADGTGLVSVNVPADPRIYETIVYVSGPVCSGPLGSEPDPENQFTRYSLITKVTGPQTLLLSNLGPPDAAGNPTHAFCVASDLQALGSRTSDIPPFSFNATAVAFDYPAFEGSYPANRSQLPTITNATTGTADLSISRQLVCNAYAIPTADQATVCAP